MRGSLILGRPAKRLDRTPGPILAPHPPADVIRVRKTLPSGPINWLGSAGAAEEAPPDDGVLPDAPPVENFCGSIWHASFSLAFFSSSSLISLPIDAYMIPPASCLEKHCLYLYDNSVNILYKILWFNLLYRYLWICIIHLMKF